LESLHHTFGLNLHHRTALADVEATLKVV